MNDSETIKLHQQYIRNQRMQLEDLRGRVSRLEKLWFMSLTDPHLKWLYENRSERMDPTVPIFDDGRAEFHLDRYRFAAEKVAGLNVADIACGTGYGCELLLEDGKAAHVTGVDISDQAIEYAQVKHGSDSIRYITASGDATGMETESLDAIVSFETIEHVPDDGALLNEFSRILKPNGMLICSTPNMWPLEIAPHHVREYDLTSFKKVLTVGFQSLEMFNQNSGTSFKFNREQERGIIPTTDENAELAECYLAVCRKRISVQRHHYPIVKN